MRLIVIRHGPIGIPIARIVEPHDSNLDIELFTGGYPLLFNGLPLIFHWMITGPIFLDLSLLLLDDSLFVLE